MTTEAWAHVKDILGEALETPSADRSRFLDARCGGDEGLRREVAALLDASDRAAGFMDTPAAGGAWPDEPASALPGTSPDSMIGRRIGPFRLISRVGAGGMGTVYRAERVEGGFEQHVAIKLIDLPAHDAEAHARFRVERQILATLHHPHVVTFIDGGLSADGHAFLVMELIDGVRVTDFCRDRETPLDERLTIVERICAAVQYAHQHGVVHRDLKPGNILVTADGMPKVLDFGIAKLTAGQADAQATATGLLRPMTPDYASPEQLRGLPVTTASDIYALGVLLYEVVAGTRPYDTSGQTLDRILDIVVKEEPPRPSQALTRSRARLPYEAAALRGDLDAIVRKAMHKDPVHRYASAQEMAGDLARHRAAEPVLAREPSLGYLLLTTARRHRAAVSAAAIALAAVLAALGVSLWQMRQATVARTRAEARFSDTRQIANALIFKVHDGIVPLPGATPVRRMIVTEALTYLERLSQDPAVDDALRLELAVAYQRIGDVQGNPGGANLGDREGARASFSRAVELLQPIASGPAASRDALTLLGNVQLELASTISALGDQAGALRTAEESIGRARAIVEANPRDDDGRSLLARAYFSLAGFVERKDALPHWQRSAEVYRELLAEQPGDPVRQRNVALVEKYLGGHYQLNRDFDAALRHYARARELDEQRLSAAPTDRTVLFDLAIDAGNIANIDQLAGRLPEAAAGYERSLAMRQDLAAADPQDVQLAARVAFVHVRLTNLYVAMGRARDALPHARQAVEVTAPLAKVDDDGRQTYASNLLTLGEVERLAGDDAAACRAVQRAAQTAAALDRGATPDPDTVRDLVALRSAIADARARCR